MLQSSLSKRLKRVGKKFFFSFLNVVQDIAAINIRTDIFAQTTLRNISFVANVYFVGQNKHIIVNISKISGLNGLLIKFYLEAFL